VFFGGKWCLKYYLSDLYLIILISEGQAGEGWGPLKESSASLNNEGAWDTKVLPP
jgi:hypothetical protein